MLWLACDAELFKQKQAPQIVSITSDKGFIVNPGDTVTLTVEANNPEDGDLSYSWEGGSQGVYLSGRNGISVVWRAPFSGGTYSIRVVVSNEDKSSDQSVNIVVRSLSAPFVRIDDPKRNAYLVQYDQTEITALADHENGIFRVRLIINDTLEFPQNAQVQGDIYTFEWDTNIPFGPAELKIVAEANITGAVGSDSVLVNIEGIVPGKNGPDGAK
jgi:hypothetical protein